VEAGARVSARVIAWAREGELEELPSSTLRVTGNVAIWSDVVPVRANLVLVLSPQLSVAVIVTV
jgi:hypothetical protein